MCKADPPGWRERQDGTPYWYAGGPNYSKPHVWASGVYDNHPAESCIFCGVTRT